MLSWCWPVRNQMPHTHSQKEAIKPSVPVLSSNYNVTLNSNDFVRLKSSSSWDSLIQVQLEAPGCPAYDFMYAKTVLHNWKESLSGNACEGMVAKVVEFYEFLVPELQPGWCVGRTKVLCSEESFCLALNSFSLLCTELPLSHMKRKINK